MPCWDLDGVGHIQRLLGRYIGRSRKNKECRKYGSIVYMAVSINSYKPLEPRQAEPRQPNKPIIRPNSP